MQTLYILAWHPGMYYNSYIYIWQGAQRVKKKADILWINVILYIKIHQMMMKVY